jgi:hypothetical protein
MHPKCGLAEHMFVLAREMPEGRCRGSLITAIWMKTSERTREWKDD